MQSDSGREGLFPESPQTIYPYVRLVKHMLMCTPPSQKETQPAAQAQHQQPEHSSPAGCLSSHDNNKTPLKRWDQITNPYFSIFLLVHCRPAPYGLYVHALPAESTVHPDVSRAPDRALTDTDLCPDSR